MTIINVVHRNNGSHGGAGDYMAWIDSDKARWGCGESPDAAIGDCIRTHGKDNGIAVSYHVKECEQ